MLVGAAEAWLAEQGVPKVQLMVRETNEAVTAFYQRLGFEFMPRINMQKWLKS
jgi:ribosomal protein S18 acetylase RimI-like enzyme